MSKHLGGIIGCQYKTSSWHLNGFPYDSNIGSTVYYRGEAHRYTVHLHSDFSLKNSTSSRMVVVIYCYIGCEDEVTTLNREQRGP